MSYDVKQVIVMRKDLKMRRGKEQAQAGHAAMAFVRCRLHKQSPSGSLAGFFSAAEEGWMFGDQKKIVVSVDSEAELMTVFNAALSKHITAHVIVDHGLTEFHGVPTATCCAIGPWTSEEIDELTKHLKLY